jgi:hypothetical protein
MERKTSFLPFLSLLTAAILVSSNRELLEQKEKSNHVVVPTSSTIVAGCPK